MARKGSQPIGGTCRYDQEPAELMLARHVRATAKIIPIRK
jgi:hypothetical protein